MEFMQEAASDCELHRSVSRTYLWLGQLRSRRRGDLHSSPGTCLGFGQGGGGAEDPGAKVPNLYPKSKNSSDLVLMDMLLKMIIYAKVYMYYILNQNDTQKKI